MHVFVLILTVFFYGVEKHVNTAVFLAPSPAACMAKGPELKATLEADGAIRDVEWACFDVTGKDKT